MKPFRLLCLGDVVGPRAVAYLSSVLWKIRDRHGLSAVVVNGENACAGNGIDANSANALIGAGADVITTGNHVFRHKSIYPVLEDSRTVVRPANFPGSCPGVGSTVVDADGVRLLVANFSGTMFMDPLDSPFDAADRVLHAHEGEYDVSVVDFHAEATSEKRAFGFYLDGRVSAVFGTHTHIETADEQILPGGTGYITDVGMCGPADSVLGVQKNIIINRFRTHLPEQFAFSQTPTQCRGVIFDIDRDTGKTVRVERLAFNE